MKQNCWCNFSIAGISLTEFGLRIPSPIVSLELSNSEVTSMTSWTLKCIVGGDDKRKINVASFEALLYSAAQAANSYRNSSGIPVAFAFGWIDEKSGVARDYLSYQGFTLTFKVSTSDTFLVYELTGYASLAIQSSVPALRIPELSGVVQPSAVAEALSIAVRATDYYDLDIDHCDTPTYISHGALTTSFNNYVRGNYSARDDFDSFPGLLPLAKVYSASRSTSRLKHGVNSLSCLVNNLTVTPLSKYLVKGITDATIQNSSFSYWIDEPTSTRQGVIHFKSNAGLSTSHVKASLQYGTADTNILSLSGSYNGVAYNMSDMSFESVGFAADGSGNTIINSAEVINSWSSNLSDVFQSVNIINDINAIASQFSGNFSVVIPGTVNVYSIAQPISLIVMSGNTLSPITGVYNVMSVSHSVSNMFTTTLKLQRLTVSSANATAASQNIYIGGSGTRYPTGAINTTPNVRSPYYIDFGEIFPTFGHITTI